MHENPYQPPQTDEKPAENRPSLLMEILFRDCPPHIALLIGLSPFLVVPFAAVLLLLAHYF